MPSVAQGRTTPDAGRLYVLQAQSGTLSGNTLTLRGVAPRATTFTDRPARLGGTIATRSLVAAWPRLFGDDPPNAAIDIAAAPESRDVALLELGRPVLNRRARTLRMRVRPLPGTDRLALRALARRADARIAARFGRVSLFIDDSTPPATITFSYNVRPNSFLAIRFDEALTPWSGPNVWRLSSQVGVSMTLQPNGFQLTTGENGTNDTATVTAPLVAGSSPLTGTADYDTGTTLTVTIPGRGTFSIPRGPFTIPAASGAGA